MTFGGAISHDLHVGYQQYVDAENLVRSSNGWGLIYGAWRPHEPRRHANLLHRAHPAADDRCGGAHPLGVPLAELRGQRHDPLAGLVLQPRRAREPRHALRAGPARRRLDALRIRARTGQQVQDVRDPVQQDDPAARRRDLGLQRHATPSSRATPATIPAASSLPRAASWDRNLIGTFIDDHFDANGVLFAAVPVGSSSGKLFVDDLTPRTIDEYLVGSARQFGRRLTARAYWRYRDAGHFWEDTNNNARIAFNPPAGIPRELYIPNLAAKLAQIGTARPTSSPSSTAPTRSTTRSRPKPSGAGDKGFVRGSYTWSHYYGNFDQDNSTHGERRQRLHRLVVHRRRRRPPALGLQGRRPARRPPAHAEDVRLLQPALERDRRRLLRRAVGSTVGSLELRAVRRADDEHERRQPAGRTGRLAHERLALADGLEVHPELPAGRQPRTCSSTPTCSTSSTIRRGTTTSPPCTRPTSRRRDRSTIHDGSSWRRGCGFRSRFEEPRFTMAR